MNKHYTDIRKIDPTVSRPDGTPLDPNRFEIGPTQLAFDEWAAAGLICPDLGPSADTASRASLRKSTSGVSRASWISIRSTSAAPPTPRTCSSPSIKSWSMAFALEAEGLTIKEGEEVMEHTRAIKGPDKILEIRCTMHACEACVRAMECAA